MIWFSADYHLFHANIIGHTNRPFNNVYEMNKTIVDNHNSFVQSNDTIYILGDLCWSVHPSLFRDMLYKLNGKINLVPGNHDKEKLLKIYKECNINILPPIYDLKGTWDEKQYHIVLSHYAMRTWNKSHHGSIHLYGHSHGTLPGYGKSFDVGVDTNNFKPYSLKDILEKVKDNV